MITNEYNAHMFAYQFSSDRKFIATFHIAFIVFIKRGQCYFPFSYFFIELKANRR